MNLGDISTQLLYTTVPLWVEREDRGQSFGTAFILSLPIPGDTSKQIPFLVTNAHVVSGARRGLVDMVERERDGHEPKLGARVRVEIDGKALTSFVDEPNDLALFPIGGLLNQLTGQGRHVFFRSVSPDLIPNEQVMSDLAAMEEVIFIGYPSGLYDERNISPIIRRGVTASPPWNNFNGKPEFLIDAGVFPGSSGSPVFIMNRGMYATKEGLSIGSNRLLFMGVLNAAIIRPEPNVPPVYLGLGRVIKAQLLREFANQIAERLAKG